MGICCIASRAFCCSVAENAHSKVLRLRYPIGGFSLLHAERTITDSVQIRTQCLKWVCQGIYEILPIDPLITISLLLVFSSLRKLARSYSKLHRETSAKLISLRIRWLDYL